VTAVRRRCAFLVLTIFALVISCPSTSANHSITDLLSIGPDGGNANNAATYSGASEDGTHLFFRTDESLVGADTDFSFDIYQRFGTTTSLMSVGSQPGVDLDTNFVAASKDGSRVFFSTRDQLVPQDTDAGLDIYERAGGVTTMFPSSSAAAATSGAVDYQLFSSGSSQDGSRMLFTTRQQLAPEDTDGAVDLYLRSTGGSFTLISVGGNAPFDVLFGAAADDASRVFFVTAEQLEGTDTDNAYDVYEFQAGAVTRASVGPDGGNNAYSATFSGISQDGTRVFFMTNESLVAFPDSDGSRQDVYERSGGTTKLVSYGPNSFDGPYDASYGGSSADGTKVWFQTGEALVSADTDGGVPDVYERSSNSTRIVSTGGGMRENYDGALFKGASRDGSRVWFEAPDSCSTYKNVYERFNGATTRVSLGGCTGNWYFQAGSIDGSRVFSTLGGGTWERFNGNFTQLQDGEFQTASLDGTRIIFHHSGQLLSADTDNAQDVYAKLVDAPVTPTAYPRPGGATPKREPLVVAYKQCTGPNRTHTAPFNDPSCSPPQIASDYLTTSNVGRMNASLRLDVLPGNVATPEDEADVRAIFSATDVLLKSDLSDYAGELDVRTNLRITDGLSGPGSDENATVSDRTLRFPVSCTPTGSTTTGSTCATTTTMDALFPGSVIERKRAIWDLGDINVYDGGPDGVASTNDNTLYLSSGVFIP
jgi:hypothetical protein